MKNLTALAIIFVVILASCSSSKQASAPYDEVYATSPPNATLYKTQDQPQANQSADNSIDVRDEDDGEEFNPEGYYDYEYSSRIRRFHEDNPDKDYYDSYYTDAYNYDNSSYSPGTSIYNGCGCGSSSWNPSMSFSMGYGMGYGAYGYNMGYGSMYGYSNPYSPYYDPFYDPYYSGWGYNSYASSYWNGYNNGYNAGYWSGYYGGYGYGYGGYGGYGGYYPTSYYYYGDDYSNTYYGPRGNRSGNSDGSSGRDPRGYKPGEGDISSIGEPLMEEGDPIGGGDEKSGATTATHDPGSNQTTASKVYTAEQLSKMDEPVYEKPVTSSTKKYIKTSNTTTTTNMKYDKPKNYTSPKYRTTASSKEYSSPSSKDVRTYSKDKTSKTVYYKPVERKTTSTSSRSVNSNHYDYSPSRSSNTRSYTPPTNTRSYSSPSRSTRSYSTPSKSYSTPSTRSGGGTTKPTSTRSTSVSRPSGGKK